MKKIKILLLVCLILPVLNISAQVSAKLPKDAGTFNREATYGCLPNSLWSQLPSPISTGWFADNAYSYTRAADDYTVAGPFSSMRLWGNNFSDCPIGGTQAFVVKFYQRNTGNPAIPGNEIFSFNVNAVPQPISLYFTTDYQVDLTFPQVTLLDGWVSITRINPGDGCYFAWYGQEFTGNAVSYYSPGNSWEPQQGTLSFCLGGEGVPETPVSNWALIIGIILIGTFVIFRFRRIA